jgi:hypothetical protein
VEHLRAILDAIDLQCHVHGPDIALRGQGIVESQRSKEVPILWVAGSTQTMLDGGAMSLPWTEG